MLDFCLNIGIVIFVLIVGCLYFWKTDFKKKKKQTQELIINKKPVISQEIINIAESLNTWQMVKTSKFIFFRNQNNSFQYAVFPYNGSAWNLSKIFTTSLTEDEIKYLEEKIYNTIRNIIISPKLDLIDKTSKE